MISLPSYVIRFWKFQDMYPRSTTPLMSFFLMKFGFSQKLAILLTLTICRKTKLILLPFGANVNGINLGGQRRQ